MAAEGKRIGSTSERAVCQCLQAACRTALRILPTTLDQDLAALVSHRMTDTGLLSEMIKLCICCIERWVIGAVQPLAGIFIACKVAAVGVVSGSHRKPEICSIVKAMSRIICGIVEGNVGP